MRRGRPPKLRATGYSRRSIRATIPGMDEFPVVPVIVVKDTPKPRRLATLAEAHAYVDQAMHAGRRAAPWRDLWHRLKAATSEEQAIEAIGDLRELLAEEDLLVPPRA